MLMMLMRVVAMMIMWLWGIIMMNMASMTM